MAEDAASIPYRRVADALIVKVRLTPKSSRDAVEGLATFDGQVVLKARVRALPEDGKANAALRALFAKWLGVPKTSVHLASGGRSRLKQLRVEGEASTLIDTINSRIAGLS